MKLILSIVQDVDADNVVERLTEAGFRVTRMSTTGGFLKSGNSTLLSGVEDEQVSAYLSLLQNNAKTREVTRTVQTISIPGTALMPTPVRVTVGGATAFVLNIVDFKKF
ncbi:cyclic-di-AMP receptor [Peptoniphilus equinus]|uniref:Cyclic-di-AMP receptor n=1 Tax=Peptoniphilus equinus TaxID=3016343 RepID=A0ABY7QSJ4_9FIRM|nr:cyclic-di-AMP receptor [Peptoniphilus equinus]WBW49759.1 cyclic-di-AMP receptor [Peptoniphilus equinus]